MKSKKQKKTCGSQSKTKMINKSRENIILSLSLTFLLDLVKGKLPNHYYKFTIISLMFQYFSAHPVYFVKYFTDFS